MDTLLRSQSWAQRFTIVSTFGCRDIPGSVLIQRVSAATHSCLAKNEMLDPWVVNWEILLCGKLGDLEFAIARTKIDNFSYKFNESSICPKLNIRVSPLLLNSIS